MDFPVLGLAAFLALLGLPAQAPAAGAGEVRPAGLAPQAEVVPAGPAAPAEVLPATFRFRKADGRRRAEAVAALARVPAGWERMQHASAAFLGTPYVVSPLGEGHGPDPDPRLRWDGVDCLTLVETALALANSDDELQLQTALDDIRYLAGTQPHVANRLHLMVAQWIPDLIAKGYLEEVTERFGPVVPVTVAYDAAGWNRLRRGELRQVPWSESLAGPFTIPMIPLAEAQRVAAELPEGLVLNVVRVARPDRLNRVTHTGVVVVRDGQRYVRHASQGRQEVVDEPIDRFLRRHAQMRQWLVEGIHLLAVRDNGARVRALAAQQAAALP